MRCVRDSNPWPHAWQACILTSWTTEPLFYLTAIPLNCDAKVGSLFELRKSYIYIFFTIFQSSLIINILHLNFFCSYSKSLFKFCICRLWKLFWGCFSVGDKSFLLKYMTYFASNRQKKCWRFPFTGFLHPDVNGLDTRVSMISRPGCQWVYLIMLLKISNVKKNIGQAVSDSMIDGIGIHHTYYHCSGLLIFNW